MSYHTKIGKRQEYEEKSKDQLHEELKEENYVGAQ